MLPLLVAAVVQAAPLRHALIVGVNDGGGVIEPLRYAERDAELFADVLVELGGFDEERVSVLYAPTPSALRRALARHATIAEAVDDDLFVFYYSGHADGSGLRLGEERYWFESLKHDLRVIDASVRIGLLDACRSGTISRMKGASIGATLFEQGSTSLEGEAWLTASAADEVAQESDHLRGGFFTHYLVSGMRGAADTGDGIVDLEELNRYTYDRVVSRTGETEAGAQHPHFDRNLRGQGLVPISFVDKAAAHMHFPPAAGGQIAVFRLPDGIQVAEVNKRSGHATTLAVSPGRYRVRRREANLLYDVTLTVTDGSLLAITDWGTARDLQTGVTRGADQLAHYLDLSERHERRLHLGHAPGVAGVASIAIPGAGQLYNGHVLKGAAYFLASSVLLAGTMIDTEAELLWPPPTALPLLGASLWGASIADAVYNVHRHEKKRPRRGGQLAMGGSFGDDPNFPWHMGLSADAILRPGLSLGIDRIGFSGYADGGWDLHMGSRLMVAVEGERWRPAVFLAFGVRHGRDRLDALPQYIVPSFVTDHRVTRAVFGAGTNVRYYVVPRYFLEAEARWEQEAISSGLRAGFGMGIHLGR